MQHRRKVFRYPWSIFNDMRIAILGASSLCDYQKSEFNMRLFAKAMIDYCWSELPLQEVQYLKSVVARAEFGQHCKHGGVLNSIRHKDR